MVPYLPVRGQQQENNMLLKEIPVNGYEKVLQCHDVHSGLKAIISLHNTKRGPALGGMRMWPYATWDEALGDANRLAQGMTYKAAAAELPFGGGKAVILGHAQRDKTERLLRAMGRFVDTLDGQYITGEDVGTTVEDMIVVRQETSYVAGLPRHMGSSGNPAPFTALGVFLGMRTCAEWAFQTAELRGMRIAVQGCGNVASHLCQHLHNTGAKLIVTDVVPEKAQRLAQKYGARVVAPEEIYHVPCEIYAPCALGGTLNDHTIPLLQCRVVAGSANNQCLGAEHGEQLRQRGIVYAPDFVINAGGLLNVAMERTPEGYNEGRVLEKVRHIASTVRTVLATAERQGISSYSAAMQLAERRLGRPRQGKTYETGETGTADKKAVAGTAGKYSTSLHQPSQPLRGRLHALQTTSIPPTTPSTG
jgi:leucine dehydrogenase